MKKNDLTGRVFGRLTVLGDDGSRKNKNILWKCQCSCGNIVHVVGWSLQNGDTKSCGCLQKEIVSKNNSTHKLTNTIEYKIWIGMKNRCYNPKVRMYPKYGGKGIQVCEEWLHSFETFLNDMGNCPKGYSIDRIDFNKNYSKDNCRWASSITQNNNRSCNRLIEFDNKYYTVAEFSRIINVNANSIYTRLRRGKSINDLIQKYYEQKNSFNNSRNEKA